MLRPPWTRWRLCRPSPMPMHHCRSLTPSTGPRRHRARRRRVVHGRVPLDPPDRRRLRAAEPLRRPGPPRGRRGARVRLLLQGSRAADRSCLSFCLWTGRREARAASGSRTTSRRSRCSTRCTSRTTSSSCASPVVRVSRCCSSPTTGPCSTIRSRSAPPSSTSARPSRCSDRRRAGLPGDGPAHRGDHQDHRVGQQGHRERGIRVDTELGGDAHGGQLERAQVARPA